MDEQVVEMVYIGVSIYLSVLNQVAMFVYWRVN
jgi:hypothetical protein